LSKKKKSERDYQKRKKKREGSQEAGDGRISTGLNEAIKGRKSPVGQVL